MSDYILLYILFAPFTGAIALIFASFGALFGG